MGQVRSLPMWIRVSRWSMISFRATMKAMSLVLKRKYTEEYFYLSTLQDRKTQVAQIDSVWVRAVKCNGILLSANQPVITLRRLTGEKTGAAIATFFYTFSTGRCLGIMKSWLDYVSIPLIRPALSILMIYEKDYPEISPSKSTHLWSSICLCSHMEVRAIFCRWK